MSALPRSIRAVAPTGPGGPEVLQLQERPLPPLASGQVLIKVGYAGVNRHDCTQRKRGTPPPGATDVFGLEVSGTIVAASADVPGTRIGQRVCALINGGGYADYCVAEAALALEYPASLSEAEAAALPEALFTFWFNVLELGGLKADQWLLVHGGTSGVASLGIQVAKTLGARVAVTAGTEAKCTACRKLGADLVINYRESDFVEAMKRNPRPSGRPLRAKEYRRASHGRQARAPDQRTNADLLGNTRIDFAQARGGDQFDDASAGITAQDSRRSAIAGPGLAAAGQGHPASDRFDTYPARGGPGACTHGFGRPCRENTAQAVTGLKTVAATGR